MSGTAKLTPMVSDLIHTYVALSNKEESLALQRGAYVNRTDIQEVVHPLGNQE